MSKMFIFSWSRSGKFDDFAKNCNWRFFGLVWNYTVSASRWYVSCTVCPLRSRMLCCWRVKTGVTRDSMHVFWKAHKMCNITAGWHVNLMEWSVSLALSFGIGHVLFVFSICSFNTDVLYVCKLDGWLIWTGENVKWNIRHRWRNKDGQYTLFKTRTSVIYH